jgi:aryl-alcohol dehydrogenase-like predicted oxidoreductase
MQYTTLAGAPLSRIGLGTWAMGGNGYLASIGRQPDDDSRAVLIGAVDAGVNWVDTAPYYGLGHAEEIVGAAVRSLPAGDRPMVFTKCGVVWADPYQPSWEDLSPASIKADCEASLRRLGLDAVDLLQIHWPEATGSTPVEQSWAAMAELADAGLTRWIGVSNFDVELLARCEAVRHVDTLQPPFSMLRRSPADREVPWCQRNGTAVLAYSPLETGMLAGSFSRERVAGLAPDDVRLERTEVFTEPQLTRCLALVELLRPIAAGIHLSLAELACGWVLSWPGLTAAIMGARTTGQLAGWIDAGWCPLPDDVLEHVAAALAATGAGIGPYSPALIAAGGSHEDHLG